MRSDELSNASDKDPQPEASASGAGRKGPPTAVGSGLSDEGGDEPGGGGGAGTPPASGWAWEELPIEELGLCMRGYNVLRRSGYLTVGQILSADEKIIRGLRNMGSQAFDELRDRLDEFGILPQDAPFGRRPE
jgi:hypothetical protein